MKISEPIKIEEVFEVECNGHERFSEISELSFQDFVGSIPGCIRRSPNASVPDAVTVESDISGLDDDIQMECIIPFTKDAFESILFSLSYFAQHGTSKELATVERPRDSIIYEQANSRTQLIPFSSEPG